LLFVDGLGVAPEGDSNLLSSGRFGGLARLAGGVPLSGLSIGQTRHGEESSVKAIDATFGVPGLPQSATGQTALFGGIEAPILEGRHVNGYPTRSLRRALEESNVLKQAREMGLRTTFLNAYRDLDHGAMPCGRRLSCTTVATMAAGIPFRDLTDLRQGRAVYHDITCEMLLARGYDVPAVSPERAAEVACAVTLEHDLVLFEFFMTDIAGHSQDRVDCVRVLGTLDRFVERLLDAARVGEMRVALASDHGNIEDMSTRSHTRAPVPFAVWGGSRRDREEALASVDNTSQVARSILGRVVG